MEIATVIVLLIVILLLFFKLNNQKKKINEVIKAANEVAEENKKLSKLSQTILDVEKMDLLEVRKEYEKIYSENKNLKSNLEKKKKEKQELDYEINENYSRLKALNEEINYVENYSLYKPQYDFVNSSKYKGQLEAVRNKQKNMIKNKTAVIYTKNWTVNGSEKEGRKMIDNSIKMILRTFNAECEAAINKIKYNNLERIENRILKSFEMLNKLNSVNEVSISQDFLNLKYDELHLGYKYEQQKEIEKEILREERERVKEERKANQEIERQKRSLDKEILHYQNAIDEIETKMVISTEEEKEKLKKQIEEMREKIERFNDEKEELEERLENTGAGYVYIISNIGAFGENVYKIGVTRRLEPLERIKELSSASVPFKFDVHALIFSYQAMDLEKELHKTFDKKRVNLVNGRKEFFNITIEEIEKVLEKYKNLTFEFRKEADAEEYRETLKLKKEITN
nr:MAG TPA: hypothetical protein [Caudoviricetes sp.]